MNEAQNKWLEHYIDSGSAVKAVEHAYPGVSEVNRASKASKLKNTLAEEIDQHGRDQYKKEVPLMLNVIKELALNGKQEAVKLKAADTWLSRAGHDAVQVIEVKKTVTHEQLITRLSIAAQGIDPKLLAGVLPDNLIEQLKPKEVIEHGKQKQH